MSDEVSEVLDKSVEHEKIPLDEVVNTYITIRNEKERRAREFQKKDQELKSDLEQLEQVMLNSCNEVNADSIKTSRGTIIKSLKEKYKNKKVLSICEIKSNSMISGAHKKNLPKALETSHHSIILRSKLSKWTIKSKKINIYNNYDEILKYINSNKNDIDIILIMSNKSTKTLRRQINK